VSKIINPLFNNNIIEEQHGFILGRSTSTNLLKFQYYIRDAFKSGQEVDVVFTDFLKAFETIDNDILAIRLK